MFKIFAEGLLTVYTILSFIFLIAGNMYLFGAWVKDFKKEKRIGAQYYYLKFWNDPGDYAKEELEELHQMLKQFEEEHNTDC